MSLALFRPSRRLVTALGLFGVMAAVLGRTPGDGVQAQTVSCGLPGANVVTCENTLPGNPSSEWDIVGAGSSSIQGFATDISVNAGGTIRFKIKSDATAYRLDIYRLGFYSGMGARKVASVVPTAPLPQLQPACLTDSATALFDCGNWGESASWAVPSTAVSGLYIAKLVRTDGTAGASHVPFVVRNDARHSDLLFQTSDTTWQAYNNYGGTSLYGGDGESSADGRGFKVSYNRPFNTRDSAAEDWLFNAEYPMIRWLEANGYDVSYASGIDSDRFGASLLNHKVFMSVGHDEYWSGTQRSNVEAARAAGVHLAFFSGNEIFWKTRWESSTDPSHTAYRTLVTYKETHANAKIDPDPAWTGTWRDPRFSPPSDGGRPENALSGTIFTVTCCSYNITVPSAEGRMRFWRNTTIASLAPNAVATLTDYSLGYEWDEDLDNGFRPAGLVPLSATTIPIPGNYLIDYGSTYGDGTATHRLTLYRHPSGSIVFGAGTVQWSWGLDATHDRCCATADLRMQQATVNLFADMGTQPTLLQAGLVAASASGDHSAPTSTIAAPLAGANLALGAPVTISGTTSDTGGGIVGAVEVSVDGGVTWHRAVGREAWTYSWVPTVTGPMSIRTRATDDSLNQETVGAGVSVTVGPQPAISIADVSVTEGNTGQTFATFDVSLSAPSTLPISVSFLTSNGTATAPTDYTAAGGIVTFNPGDTHRSVNVAVNGDTTQEPDETFFVTLSLPDGATLLRAVATGIVVNDDVPPPPVDPTFSLWDSLTSPALADGFDGTPVEVGVKFRASTAGFITGLRYYKSDANTGPHVANLWTSTGTLLATAPYTSETTSGWQQVILPTPVAVDAGALYVASYYAPHGHYAFSGGYFSSPFTNGPLTAPSADAAGGNAVYKYSYTTTFPDQFSQANYWVDVVFTTSLTADTTPPVVALAAPAPGVSGYATTTPITAIFSEAIRQATLDSARVIVRDSANALVPGSISYVIPQQRMVFQPASPLQPRTTYSVTIKGGAAGIVDLAGNPLASDYIWSFTTAAAITGAPGDGPGGPILVVVDASRPFGRYYAEILRGEGLNEFAVATIDQVSASTLAAYDVVVLAEMPLTGDQVTMFSSWVTGGGRLIAMKPDKQLATLLGLSDAAATVSDGYLQFDTASGPGVGLVAQSIQFHGVADRYNIVGATPIAMLHTPSDATLTNPAASLRSVGTNGGQAAAFAFDVARSIVYTRQGNPAWAGQDRDGLAPIRSDDLFFGNAVADPKPDFVDFSRITIPQADELQRFLANLIIRMNATRKPLPRFWYLPRGLKATVVMTGDDHRNGGTAGRFDHYMALSPPGCSVDDWQCVRATGYVMIPDPLTETQAAAFAASGFEVALHITTECLNYTQAQLESLATAQLGDFASAHPTLPAPATNRTHCVPWSDWASQAKVESNHGIRLDTTYYYYPASWIGMNWAGLFTGSGMPQRFADADGTLIDVYQAVTQMTDESGQGFPDTANQLLDNALGPAGFYGVFTANMHQDEVPHAAADTIIAAAQSRGVPVVSSRQMLDWLDGRNGSRFSAFSWDGRILTFDVVTAAGARGLQGMVPADNVNGVLESLKRNGSTIPFTLQVIKGIRYAVFGATDGTYEVTYPVPTASIADASVTEGNAGTSSLTFAVTLSAASVVPVSVAYATSDGTATAGVDYVAQSGTVTFAPGETTKTVTVTVTADSLSEADETLAVTLSAPVNAVIGRAQATGTIVDDDPVPSVSIADTSAAEGNGPNALVFTVSLSTASGQPVTVSYATGDGTATAPSDYVAATGSVTFPPGSTTQTVSVFVNGDFVVEPDETLKVTLVSATHATINRATAVGTLLNDDTPPVMVSLSPATAATAVMIDTPVDVTFNRAMNPASFTPVTFRLRAAGSATDVPALLLVTGSVARLAPAAMLSVNTSYTATVTGAVTDTFGNPLGTDIAWSFTTSRSTLSVFVDTNVVDFGAGTVNGTFVSQKTPYTPPTPPGELILAPTVGNSFTVNGIPSGWSTSAWSSGGNTTVTGGVLSTNGGRAFTTSLYTPGRTLEFLGFFSPIARAQYIGFGNTLASAPWAAFCTNTGGILSACTNNGSTTINTPLGASALNAWHLFRIAWTTTSVTYFIDDVQVAAHAVAITASMRPIIGDQLVDNEPLVVDYLAMSPYGTTGTFVSRVFDSGSPMTRWSTISWHADMPTGTGLQISVRTGNTAAPDGSWSPYAPLNSGASIGRQARYAQYSVAMNTTNTLVTPVLRDVTLAAAVGPSLSINDVSVTEGDTGAKDAVFTVTLTNVTDQAVTVSYTTADVTARVSNADYAARSGVLTFQPGVPSQQIAVPVTGDTFNEPTETFVVNLTDPAGATLTRSQGVGTIVNDDPLPTVTVNDVSQNEGNSGPTSFSFTVSLSAASGQTVTVNYATADATARVADGDYVAASGTLTFAPGTTTATVAVQVTGDTTFEPTETFALNLSAPTNATIAKAQGIGTVVNDDVDSTAPAIVSRSPAAGAPVAALSVIVSATFSETMDPATISNATFTLLAAGSDIPLAVTVGYSGTTATLTPASSLAPSTTYTATVSGTVADLNGNPMGADASWSFTTVTATPQFTDTTTADFSAGTAASTSVVQLTDGDVVLAPTVNAEFAGTALPAGWTSSTWATGGTVTVSGGVVRADGAKAFTSTLYGPGRSLEFVATFGTSTFEHVGFALDANNPPWAIFSTYSGNGLYVRTASSNTTSTNTLIPGSWLGAPHRYRIDWTSTAVVYSIDGTQVASHPIAITASMRPLFSDVATGGGSVAVDWLRMTPYATAGTFSSRVIDAGGSAVWASATWSATVPTGTSLAVSVRAGDTAVPDGTWTPWIPVATPGAAFSAPGRYVQYKVDLATTDTTRTPILASMTVAGLIP